MAPSSTRRNQVSKLVVQTFTVKQTDRCKTPKAVQEPKTAVDFDQVGREIHEAIKDLPPSLGESETSWPEDTSNLKSLIEIGMSQAETNTRPAATGTGMVQNPSVGYNTPQIQAYQPIYPAPGTMAHPGNFAYNNRQFGVGSTAQQPQPGLPPPPGLPHPPGFTPQSGFTPKAHQSPQSGPVISAGSWSLGRGPIYQSHMYTDPQRYSGPPQNQASLRPQDICTSKRFREKQNMQLSQHHQMTQAARTTQAPQIAQGPQVYGQTPQSHQVPQRIGLELSNGSQHNGRLRRGVGYNQSTDFQQNDDSQQNGSPQQNGSLQQDGGFQQNNSFQPRSGFPQPNGFRQRNGLPQSNGLPHSQASHESQASSKRRRKRSITDPDGDEPADELPRQG